MEGIDAVTFYPLGNSALLVKWGNAINREISHRVNALAIAINNHPFVGLVDVVPAYSSLTIIFDTVLVKKENPTFNSANDYVKHYTGLLLPQLTNIKEETLAVIEIPVCYDGRLQNDLREVSNSRQLSIEDIISIHTRYPYYVYMQGFIPGFAYMGELDERLNLPRKLKPYSVRAGAVGIAGRQTGIYPTNSPGGWHILGYTPLQLFNATKSPPCLLIPGTLVQFKAIDYDEFCLLKMQTDL
jgi:inhibitor of KinA